MNKKDSKIKKFIFTFLKTISIMASILVYAFFVIILWLFDPSWFFLTLGVMLVLTTIVVYLIKWLYPTKRPDHGARKVKYFWQKVDLSSFPSAHAARTSGLFVVSLFYTWYWLWIASFVFFCLVIYSRVYLKRHYWKDIFGGSIIGGILGVASYYLAQFISSIVWLRWLF